jgi:hypothetical protein
MSNYLLIFWLLGIAQLPPQHTEKTVAELQREVPSHAIWDTLLLNHVSRDGMVDYKSFQNDRPQLESYLEYLAEHAPDTHWSREEKLAYYINLYNAGTVRLILDHYPLNSIKDIRKPWGKKRLRIGEESYSLNDIEHGILRKMGEPRIHFAVNCASFSCPKLLPEAFRAKDIDLQLDAAARAFINDPLHNRIKGSSAEISRLFKWYKGDFTREGGTLISYLNTYLKAPLPEDAKLDFLPYNWSLNDSR